MTDELDRLYDTFTDSVFRLETLQVYDVPVYDERFCVFTLEGRLLPPPPPLQAWLGFVRERTAAGRRIHRVHVLDVPLTPYLRYELAVYPENIAAGEEVRIADRAWHPALDELRRDFILFDGDTDHAAAVWVRYTPEGRVLGWDPSTDLADVERCRHDRDTAIAHSVDLAEFTVEARAS